MRMGIISRSQPMNWERTQCSWGGTAVAPGFKWKPAEPQPMGVFQEECSNIYQVQEPGWNTHKETQPVYEGGEEFIIIIFSWEL